ncbi:ABC transporter permease [Fervidibacillus albus]|uniref:ABC transporter permease n=1 Tax=Fervidibacillus albus TaxID=2980026 RepID=A0A9E8LTV6_9BACI|nr:ABC transporter permease [Fervidibacillus albus]WAA08709.1 ABC transporter permease [Fervidibacillus albus]
MNRDKLWTTRAGERFREIFRYSRYMFNDHLLFVIIIGIGGGAYYYQNWVRTLTTDFPTPLVFSVIFAFLLAYGNIITFFKRPDQVFLLPLETKLQHYLRRSFLLTILWHTYTVGFALILLAPIFFQTEGDSRWFFLFVLLLLLLKVVNLVIRWYVDFETDRLSVIVDLLLRTVFNGLFVYFYLEKVFFLFGVLAVVFLIYGFYFYKKNYGKPLPWERLVDNEERRMSTFYRFANLFTDVPQLKNEVKRRKWLDFLFRNVRYSENGTYFYLLTRTFIRSGDYLGLFIRLTVIGTIFLIGMEGYIRLFVAILFMYLTGFQLWGLWKHHRSIVWTSLYPVDEREKDRSFVSLLARILIVQMILFVISLVAVGELVQGIELFIVLSLFIYLFVYLYTKNQLEKWRS